MESQKKEDFFVNEVIDVYDISGCDSSVNDTVNNVNNVNGGYENYYKKSYIVKRAIPSELLFDFLEKICSVKEGVRDGKRVYYFITFDVYRKMNFEGLSMGFVESLREYYLPCFQAKYLDKDLTYNRFNTLIRQICKVCHLKWEVLEQQDELCKVQYIVWV